MPSVTTRRSGNPTVGDLLVLEDERAASRVELSPARGALVTSFRVGERDVLYMDEATLVDPAKSVRGGIPVLFPSPGKLVDDTWTDGTRTFSMKQHGFARNLPWSVDGSTAAREGTASVTLVLASTPATLPQFPWPFRMSLAFSLSGAALRITSRVRNDGTSEMPFGLGYHPYFAVADKARTRIDTRATRAFDNVTKKIAPFTGFDLTAAEVDLHLLDHGSTESALHSVDGARVDVRASSEFTRWVVWTLAGKPFVCLEPWTCPGNALNTGEGLSRLGPGASLESWIEVAVTG
jgi:galactose mutarotase-like enzyme